MTVTLQTRAVRRPCWGASQNKQGLLEITDSPFLSCVLTQMTEQGTHPGDRQAMCSQPKGQQPWARPHALQLSPGLLTPKAAGKHAWGLDLAEA